MTHAEIAASVATEGLAIATIAAAAGQAKNLTIGALTLTALGIALLFDHDGQNAVITSALGMTVGAMAVHLNQTVNRIRQEKTKAEADKKAQAPGRVTA